MQNKMENFQDDLNRAFSEVRAVLDHWGLKGWQEYLLVRLPNKPESYVVLANPKDMSGFDKQLIDFHRTAVARQANDSTES